MQERLVFSSQLSFVFPGCINCLKLLADFGYGMEIEDKRIMYGECTCRPVPREDEPRVYLMYDWIYLPNA